MSPGPSVLIVYDSRRGSVERLACEVLEGARSVAGTTAAMKRVGDVSRADLLACDGLAVGSPVHTGTVSMPVKQFFDRWHFEFDFYPARPMRNRVGAAFAAGGQSAGGRELTLLTILSAMSHHRMVVVSGGGALGATASTETKADAVDTIELAEARDLGQRLAEIAGAMWRARVTT